MDAGGTMIPVHKPEPDINRPGYCIDAKLGATMSVMVGSMLPGSLAAEDLRINSIKRQKQWDTHSMKEVIDAASAEWFKYCDMFKDYGYEKDIPPYPYSLKFVQE